MSETQTIGPRNFKSKNKPVFTLSFKSPALCKVITSINFFYPLDLIQSDFTQGKYLMPIDKICLMLSYYRKSIAGENRRLCTLYGWLVEVYILATSKIISGQVLTFDTHESFIVLFH